jgi:hypothetical protein
MVEDGVRGSTLPSAAEAAFRVYGQYVDYAAPPYGIWWTHTRPPHARSYNTVTACTSHILELIVDVRTSEQVGMYRGALMFLLNGERKDNMTASWLSRAYGKYL